MRLLRLDTTGRIIETKPPDEHVVGRPVLDLVVPEERNRAQELLQAGRHGDPAWAELHLALGNGLQRYLVASVPEDSGTISWSLRPAKESSEQRFEDESQIEHWLGRFLIEQIEIAVLAFDKSLTLRYCNDQVAKVLPLQNAELPLGTSFEALTRSLAAVVREPQGLIETLHHALLANSPLRQVECVLHDGRTLELDYLPVLQNPGSVAHVLRLRDISGRRVLERRADVAEARYHELVELLPIVVYRAPADAVAEMSYVSPQIQDLLSYTAEEWVSQRGMWARHLHPDDRERVVNAVERALVEHGSFALEYRMVHRDGRVVWVQDWGRVHHDERGHRWIHGALLDVTGRKQAEQARGEAEQRLTALIEALPAMVCSVEATPVRDAAGVPYYPIRYLNEYFTTLTGFPVEALREDPSLYAQLIHPDDHAIYTAECLRTDETGEPFDLQYRLIRSDGSVIWVHERAVPLRDNDGTILAWQCVIVDVTRQKEIEQALREAEARYRTLVEQLPGVVLVRPLLDAKEKFFAHQPNQYVSSAIRQLTGYAPEEWDTRRFVESLHPDDRERVVAAVLAADRAREPLDIEYRLRRADGTTVWVWSTSRVVTSEEGEPLFRQVLLMDISDRKCVEQALREAEARYRTLVEQLPGAVILRSHSSWQLPDGSLSYDFFYVSPSIERLTGFRVAEWQEPGRWSRQIHPDDRDRVLAALLESERTGSPLDLEYRFIRKDGSVIWLWHITRVLFDAEGKPQQRQVLLLDITERKQAELRLRDAEGQFRSLVEQVPGALFILGRGVAKEGDYPTYPVRYVSPQITELTGYTPEEWVQRGISVYDVYPEDQGAVMQALREFWQSGGRLRLEYRFQHRDGRLVWHRMVIWPCHEVSGQVTAWYGLLLDITAERALREAEERYRNLVEQLPAVVYVEGVAPVRYPDGRVDRPLLYVSPQIRELTGYTAEEHQQNRSLWIQAIHPEDYPRVRQETRAAWSSGRFQSEFRIIRRDGVIRWLESTARLIRDAEGQPLYWQGVMLDVTARKEIEQALREAEERYRALVEQIPAAVIVTAAQPVVLSNGTLHYPILYVSQKIAEVTGFTREEFESIPGLSFTRIHPEDQPRIAEEAVRTDETGEPFTVVYRFQRKDGRWVWHENRAVLIRDGQGQPLFWHGLLIDVTDRKRGEELLVGQTRLLQMIAEAAPLSEVLDQLARLVEEQEPALLCLILILDEQGRLHHGAAPSLPPAYVTAIDGLRIGPNVGSCGTAAFFNQPIFVEDTSTDPRWADFRELAERFGLRACWSTPIRDQNGVVLGTVALYAREPRGPRPEEQQLLDFTTQLAALALERWRETEELRYRAFHDPLTGLANRLLFLDRLEHARARASRDGSGLAVLFVDLDDFKEINDTWGHSAGDLVLQEVAERLALIVRSGDTVARFAGDEFTVLLEGVSTSEEVAAIAQRLMDSTVEPIELGETTVKVSFSVGAALAVGRHLPDSGSMLLAADQALYAAKRRGKSCFELVVVRGEANHGVAWPVSPDAEEERGTA